MADDPLRDIQEDTRAIKRVLMGDLDAPESGLLQRHGRVERQVGWLLKASGVDPETGKPSPPAPPAQPAGVLAAVGAFVGGILLAIATAWGLTPHSTGASSATHTP